jgi:ankyrin repeat protein
VLASWFYVNLAIAGQQHTSQECYLRSATGPPNSAFSSASGIDALNAAVRSGRLAEVQKWVGSGGDVNARDAVGSTPLHAAVLSARTEIAIFLLDHGANVNALQAQTGATPLEYAVLSGATPMVKLLLAARARTDLRDHAGDTVLHLAARSGNVEIIHLLLPDFWDIDAVNLRDHTALDEAVLYDRDDIVLTLFEHGANPNRARRLDGRTPLDTACIKGFANLVEPLIAGGADPNQRDRFGQLPIDLALAYKNAKVVRVLLRLGAGSQEAQHAARDAMASAVVRGQTETVTTLIESGFDINQRTSFGSTYLHDAALKGQGKMVALLLDQGAHVDARDDSGGTALHDAALGGDPKVIEVLLNRGANIDARDGESGATPLMLAASLGRTGAVSLLLRRGANVDLKDHAGRTALDRAKEIDDPGTLKLLESSAGHSKVAHSAKSDS